MRKLIITSQYQPSRMVRLELEYLTERAAIRRIPTDEEKNLLQRIRSGDATAIYPLVNSQEFIILNIAKQYLHTKVPVAEMVAAARIALSSLLQNELNNTGTKHYERFRTWNIQQAIMRVVYNRQPYQQNTTINATEEQQNFALHKMLEQHIPFLNRLNRELKKVETQIVERATALLIAGKLTATDEPPTSNNEVVEATVAYYCGEDETLAHTFRTSFTYAEAVHKKNYGPLQESVNQTDWHRTSYMPLLDESYCYLLHDLIEPSHKGISFSVHQINRIAVSVSYGDEWGCDLGNGERE